MANAVRRVFRAHFGLESPYLHAAQTLAAAFVPLAEALAGDKRARYVSKFVSEQQGLRAWALMREEGWHLRGADQVDVRFNLRFWSFEGRVVGEVEAAEQEWMALVLQQPGVQVLEPVSAAGKRAGGAHPELLGTGLLVDLTAHAR